MSTLYVTEIYLSIQGESSYVGKPCVFIRLSGCPLRCRWCDTSYSFAQGTAKSIDQILAEVKAFDVSLVELTGGEPLAQESCKDLAAALIANGHHVLIETGGSEDIRVLPPEVHVIMDIKCPGSNMADRNLWSNIEALKPTDEIKFVIADKNDFDWAVALTKEKQLERKCQLLFSPAFALVKPADLAQWVLDSHIDCRMQLQIHKYIWNPRAKGV